MIDWLKKDLSQNQSKWTVVLFHSPPYTKGSHDSDNLKDSWGKMHYMRENVLPILEKHSVDMVLSGHSQLSRTIPLSSKK
jgi:3',5'-cyclic AMP phosphodiesterase CpdA